MLCQECSLPTFRSKGRTRLHWFLSSYNPGPLYLENVLMKRKVLIGGKSITGIAFGRHGKPVTLKRNCQDLDCKTAEAVHPFPVAHQG